MNDLHYYNSIFDGLRPLKTLSVSEWADKYRMLSRVASSEAGHYRTDRTPFLKKIMDCLSVKATYQMVIFMKGSQVGSSELGMNWIGYTIDHDPSPMMLVLPTDKLIKRFVNQRIDPMIEETPVLREKISTTKKDSTNTKDYKAFKGGALVISGANSPSSLRSMPAEKIFADEIDAYPKDAGGEGSPLSLAMARQRTFSRKKVLAGSTPVMSGSSLIESMFEDTDKNFYYVPCPECGHMQQLVFEGLRWNEASGKVWYECESKKCEIQNWQKTEMLEKGEWIPENPDKISDKRIGFHLSSLYSPVGWMSWEQIIFDENEGYLAALKSNDDVKMKVFRNTILGLTFSKKSEVPDQQRLWERSRSVDFKFNEPHNDVLFLTASVDVQADRLECLIVGWGRRKINWTVDYRVFYGDTSQSKVYEELDNLLNEMFKGKNGHLFRIEILAIDTGFNTQVVYNWARGKKRVMAIKGYAAQRSVIANPTFIDVKKKGGVIKKGLKLWPVGSSIIKQEIYTLLRLDKPKPDEKTPDGFFWILPFAEDFFSMLTAERMVFVKDKSGYEQIKWEQIRPRNEILDLYVYNIAAASNFGIDRFRTSDWERLENLCSWKPAKNVVTSKVVNIEDEKTNNKKVDLPKSKPKMTFGKPSIL